MITQTLNKPLITEYIEKGFNFSLSSKAVQYIVNMCKSYSAKYNHSLYRGLLVDIDFIESLKVNQIWQFENEFESFTYNKEIAESFCSSCGKYKGLLIEIQGAVNYFDISEINKDELEVILYQNNYVIKNIIKHEKYVKIILDLEY